MREIKVKLLSPTAKLPVRAHVYDAGLDVFADEEATLCTDRCTLVGTGLALEVRPGHVATVLPRSSLSLLGIHVYTGTIDCGYTGQFYVAMQLISDRVVKRVIKRGEKIAQLVVSRCELPTPVAVDVLTTWGTRGPNGWGSSGSR